MEYYRNCLGNYWFPPYGSQQTETKIIELPVQNVPATPESEAERTPHAMADSFLERVLGDASERREIDFSSEKTVRSRDRINLILESIADQEMVKYRNLTSLYRDLLTVDKMIVERPILPQYQDDSIFFKLNGDKLRLYDSIRKQLSETAKANSFMTKELIEALLDYKKQTTKTRLMGDDPGSFLGDNAPYY